MTKRIRWMVMCLLLGSRVFAAEPDPAARFPSDTFFLISIRDARPLAEPIVRGIAALLQTGVEGIAEKEAQTFLSSLRRIAKGRLSFAVLPRDGRMEQADFLITLPVDETQGVVADILNRELVQWAGERWLQWSKVDGLNRLHFTHERTSLWWKLKDGLLYVSNSRRVLKKMPLAKGTPTLAGSDFYRRVGQHVNWTGDVTAFLDLEATLWREVRKQLKRRGKLRFGHVLVPDGPAAYLGLDQVPAVGASWTGNGRTGSGRLAVLTPKTRKGLALLFDTPNVRMADPKLFPANAQAFFSGRLHGKFLTRLAEVMRALDPDIQKEFREDLAAFNRELGVDLEEDLFDNVGVVAGVARLSLLGEPGFYHYNVIEVRAPARLQACLEALAKYNKTPIARMREDREYFVLPFKSPIFYTFEGQAIHLSSRFENLDRMLALKGNGRTLADAKIFQALRKRLPETSAAVGAVDLKMLSKMAVLALTSGQIPPRLLPVNEMIECLRPLDKAAPGLSLGFALRNEPGAFVLYTESETLDLWAALLEATPAILKMVGKMELRRVGPQPPLRRQAAFHPDLGYVFLLSRSLQ